MNEQIRELAEQAAEDIRVKYNNAYWRMQDETKEDAAWREKFALLIIEECAQRAEAYAYMSANFTALAEELRRMVDVK